VEISDIEAQLTIFGITDDTRKVLATTWPIIRPRMAGAIDNYFDNAVALFSARLATALEEMKVES
jgi:hypothetical protein